MNEYQLIRKIESLGSWFSITPDNELKIHGVKNIPADILDAVKLEKSLIKKIVQQDYTAKTQGWVVAIPGELYTLTISCTMGVFIERSTGGLWSAWRETWIDQNKKASSCYVIVEKASFRRALARAKDYVSYLEKNKKRGQN